MKITLTQRGGLVAMARPPLVLDADKLGEADRRELERLVAAAAAAQAPPSRAGMRDAMSHTLTVEGGSAPIVLKQSDGALSPEFGRLIGWLKQKA